MSKGHRVGKHRIQGISDEFVPPIVHLKDLDNIIAVDDGDAIRMAQALASKLGLGVGISSGVNFLGAVKKHEKLGEGSVVVTVFSDSNKKYLSTDLLHDEPRQDVHIEPEIELLGFTSINRSCQACDAGGESALLAGVAG
jgi:cysteine synthase